MKTTKKLVSVSQLANMKRQSPQAIRKAILDKRIDARKIGKQWVIEIEVKKKK
jgi:hypothetical protein